MTGPPYVCPLCLGEGKRRTERGTDALCHACDGRGIVWPPEPDTVKATAKPYRGPDADYKQQDFETGS